MRFRYLVLLTLSASVAGAVPPSTNGLAPAAPAAVTAPSNDIAQTLASVAARHSQAEKALDELAKEAALAHARTIARGRAYVKSARAGLLPVGSGFDSLTDHAVRVERLRRALERDQRLERKIAQRRKQVAAELKTLTLQLGPLQAQKRVMDANRAALMAQQDRALAFQRAFSSGSAGTAIYGAAPGGAGPMDQPAPSGFAARKGKLSFPLEGRTEVRTARRPGGGPGLEMLAPPGTKVRAIHPGKVAFADAYAEYGKTVIIDHGDNHYVVNSGLRTIDVSVGDTVSSGTRLGSVGASGALYFEVRIGSQTADPSEWFGI